MRPFQDAGRRLKWIREAKGRNPPQLIAESRSLSPKWPLELFKASHGLRAATQKVQAAKRKEEEEQEKNLPGAQQDEESPEPN